ncbi:MAG: hypothetical protein K8Q89_07210 [Nitrosarchaeum sp.]|nr:hypothetical protein [Nitrosarchaeum sp.]
MNGNFLGVIVLVVFGMSVIFVFSTVGHGSTLATSVGIDKINALHVNDLTGYGMKGLNLKAANTITVPNLTFQTGIPCNTWVHIFFYDDTATLIGQGDVQQTGSCPGSDTTINNIPMSDTVTAAERFILTSVTVTVT